MIDDSVGVTAKEQKIYQYILDSNRRKQTVLLINKLDINYKPNEFSLGIADYYDLWVEKLYELVQK